FGQNVTVLPGVKIGDGAIIGANSVVTKDVAPYTIVGGNPIQLIGPRFEPEVIQALENLAWWNKDIEWITDRKSTRLNSSHVSISYAVFCLKKKKHSSGY